MYYSGITGGAQSWSGGYQYGYSLGDQFPPNIADKAPSLAVLLTNFLIPLRFDYDTDVINNGVALKR